VQHQASPSASKRTRYIFPTLLSSTSRRTPLLTSLSH
jgi:hypothetical protein